jgi:hypothetical protein
MSVEENIKYQLETLASYEPSDLDNPEFEVGYENEAGNEGFLTVCCIDLAKRTIDRIEYLEAKNKDLLAISGELDLKVKSLILESNDENNYVDVKTEGGTTRLVLLANK